MNSASGVMTGIINGAIGSITGTNPSPVTNAASSGLPAEALIVGIVIAVALWSVVLWIGFKK